VAFSWPADAVVAAATAAAAGAVAAEVAAAADLLAAEVAAAGSLAAEVAAAAGSGSLWAARAALVARAAGVVRVARAAAYPGDRAACAKSAKRLSGPVGPWPPDLASPNDPVFLRWLLARRRDGSCCRAVISVRPGMWAALEVFLQI
jgi:hypothetical protein